MCTIEPFHYDPKILRLPVGEPGCRHGAVIRSFLVSANDPDTGVPRNMSTLPLVSTEGISGIRVVLVCRLVREHRRFAAGPAVLLGDKAVYLVSELTVNPLSQKLAIEQLISLS